MKDHKKTREDPGKVERVKEIQVGRKRKTSVREKEKDGVRARREKDGQRRKGVVGSYRIADGVRHSRMSEKNENDGKSIRRNTKKGRTNFIAGPGYKS